MFGFDVLESIKPSLVGLDRKQKSLRRDWYY